MPIVGIVVAAVVVFILFRVYPGPAPAKHAGYPRRHSAPERQPDAGL
jgi:hypothetical protein